MTPAQLATIGRALYGERWQSDLARALGLNARSVRRWAAGAHIPEAKRDKIRFLVRDRIDELQAASSA